MKMVTERKFKPGMKVHWKYRGKKIPARVVFLLADFANQRKRYLIAIDEKTTSGRVYTDYRTASEKELEGGKK